MPGLQLILAKGVMYDDCRMWRSMLLPLPRSCTRILCLELWPCTHCESVWRRNQMVDSSYLRWASRRHA